MARVTGTGTSRDVDRIHDERRYWFSQDRESRPDGRLSDEGQRRQDQGRVGQQDRTGRQSGRSSEPSNRPQPEPDLDFNLNDFFGGGSGGLPSAPQQAGLFSGNLPLLIGGIGLLAGGAYYVINQS